MYSVDRGTPVPPAPGRRLDLRIPAGTNDPSTHVSDRSKG